MLAPYFAQEQPARKKYVNATNRVAWEKVSRNHQPRLSQRIYALTEKTRDIDYMQQSQKKKALSAIK